jgi:hypothetical protein
VRRLSQCLWSIQTREMQPRFSGHYVMHDIRLQPMRRPISMSFVATGSRSVLVARVSLASQFRIKQPLLEVRVSMTPAGTVF